jgi:drug/metabolite transporter (DMT)-like permease
MPNPSPAAKNSAAHGILMMLGAVGCLAAMNMFVKLVGPDYSPFQAVFFRNGLAALMVVPLVLRVGGLAAFKTRRPGGHAIRSLTGVLGNASFFTAYALIPLSDGMSIAMAVPIFTAMFAIPILGEKIGVHRWAAIFVGFLGVLIALKPTGDFHVGSLFALSGTVFWALTLVLIRSLSSTESPYTIVFYYMVSGFVISAFILPWVWVTPTPEALAFYIGAGLVGGCGQIFMTYAMKLAPASVVTPFEYTAIFWALAFDLVIWDALPSSATLTGGGVVILTGLYIWHRETRTLHRGP